MRIPIFVLVISLALSAFNQTLTDTNLPILKLYTNGQTIEDEVKVTVDMGIINGGVSNNVNDPYSDYDGKVGIEFRGNSTQGYDKKTYSIELRGTNGADTAVSLLGMPTEEDWILHAMVIDKTLLRIPLSSHLMWRMGHYAYRWRFVEVLLDDNYQGVYILTEKIKRDAGRVDIDKLDSTDVGGIDISGGYILRIDWDPENDEELDLGFDSKYKSNDKQLMFFQYYYPKATNITPIQKSYIRSYMMEFEDALFSKTKYNTAGRHYSEYIDLTAFADFIIINELSRNSDGYKLSSYVTKENDEEGGKMRAGPIWDFDQTYGISHVCGGDEYEGWNYTQEHKACEDNTTMPRWYIQLMDDPLFQNHIKCRWEKHRAGPLDKDSINNWIDTQVAYFNDAKERNFQKWNFIGEEIWSEPHPIPETYNEEISYMKNWISNRIDWIDTNLPGDCKDDVTPSLEFTTPQLEIYPSPSSDKITVKIPVYYKGIRCRILDMYGQIVREGYPDSPTFEVDVSALSNGVYSFETCGIIGTLRKRFVKV